MKNHHSQEVDQLQMVHVHPISIAMWALSYCEFFIVFPEGVLDYEGVQQISLEASEVFWSVESIVYIRCAQISDTVVP